MSWQAQKAVKDIKTGSATRKAVLMVMADYAKEDGSSIFASMGSIADRAELSRRSVITAVAEMVSAGILIKEEQATGSITRYAIHPAIMGGHAAYLTLHTCEALSQVEPESEEATCEAPSQGVCNSFTGGVNVLHRGCEGASHKLLTNNQLTNQLTNESTPALVVIEPEPLLEVPEDPWYDPKAFPNEDALAQMIAVSIESVPKFSGSADRPGCIAIAGRLRDQFPLGPAGEIDPQELASFLEEWAIFNRSSKRRGGSKDGVASLRNWVARLEAQHRNTRRARERDRGYSGTNGLRSSNELAAIAFSGGAA